MFAQSQRRQPIQAAINRPNIYTFTYSCVGLWPLCLTKTNAMKASYLQRQLSFIFPALTRRNTAPTLTPLFSHSTDGTPFIFRIGQGSEMERAIKMDRDLSQYGKAEVLSDKLSSCLKKATGLARTGLVLSVGPVGRQEKELNESPNNDPQAICKQRNQQLTR